MCNTTETCPKCGATQEDGRFCKSCGTELTAVIEKPDSRSTADETHNKPTNQDTNPTQQTGPSNLTWALCFFAILLVIVVIYFAANGTLFSGNKLDEAYQSCSQGHYDSVSYDEQNKALTINDTDGYNCVVQKMDIPSQITERVDSANTIMGEQSGSWDNYSATWSYNGSSGNFVMVITQK